jgi:hypothetical protein
MQEAPHSGPRRGISLCAVFIGTSSRPRVSPSPKSRRVAQRRRGSSSPRAYPADSRCLSSTAPSVHPPTHQPAQKVLHFTQCHLAPDPPLSPHLRPHTQRGPCIPLRGRLLYDYAHPPRPHLRYAPVHRTKKENLQGGRIETYFPWQ